MYNKPLLILEKIDFIPESKEELPNGNLRLSGNFAIFNITNENDRIYEWTEYKPHMTYLQEKATRKKLFGELNHPPDRFDVDLSRVSHMVESLYYDEKTNTVKGSIRLFNTAVGRDAQEIVKGGGILSLSSRAAGSVNEGSRKVSIKRIFTYDLVGDGGFGVHAELKRVNEDIGIMNENVAIYELSDSYIKNVKDPEIKGVLNEILLELNPQKEMTENTKKIETKYIKKTNKKINEFNMNNKTNPSYVTKDQLNSYSKAVKKSVDSLSEQVKTLSGGVVNKMNENEILEIKNNVKNIIAYTNKIANRINENSNPDMENLHSYVKYLGETLNKAIGYSEYLSKTIGKDIRGLKEESGQTKEYFNYLAEMINNNVNHNDYLVESLNKLAGYVEYISTTLNESINHTDHVAENVNKLTGYTTYISETVNKGLAHNDYLAETLNNVINHNDYLAETADKTIGYVEYIGRNALPSLPKRDGSAKNKDVNESRSSLNESTTTSGRINNFLQQVENQKTVNESHEYVKSLLSSSNAYRFSNLNEIDKIKVSKRVVESKCRTENEVLKIWEETLLDPTRTKVAQLHKYMPVSLKEHWNNLTEPQQRMVEEKTRFWDLSNPTKVRDFIMKMNISEMSNANLKSGNLNKPTKLNILNESNGNSDNPYWVAKGKNILERYKK